MDNGPVYIGGLSYSGKTQLSRMLMAQGDLLITRRTYLWTRHYGRYGDLSAAANLARCLEAVLAAPGVAALEPDRPGIERDFRAGPPTYARLFAIIHAQHAARRGARRWGDQLGGVEQHAAIILAADETARLIHMVRDPRGRMAMVDRAGGRPGRAGYELRRWRQSAQLGLDQTARCPGRYLLLRYEDLRGRPETTLRRVCAFLDEPFAPAMLPDPALWATLWANDPFLDGQTALEARAAAYIERHAAPLMAACGYEPRPGRLGLWQRARLVLFDEPVNRAGIWARERRPDAPLGSAGGSVAGESPAERPQAVSFQVE